MWAAVKNQLRDQQGRSSLFPPLGFMRVPVKKPRQPNYQIDMPSLQITSLGDTCNANDTKAANRCQYYQREVGVYLCTGCGYTSRLIPLVGKLGKQSRLSAKLVSL